MKSFLLLVGILVFLSAAEEDVHKLEVKQSALDENADKTADENADENTDENTDEDAEKQFDDTALDEKEQADARPQLCIPDKCRRRHDKTRCGPAEPYQMCACCGSATCCRRRRRRFFRGW